MTAATPAAGAARRLAAPRAGHPSGSAPAVRHPHPGHPLAGGSRRLRAGALLALTIVAGIAGAGCADAPPRAESSWEAPVARRADTIALPRVVARDSFWRVRWSVGGAAEPDRFYEPREMLAVGDRLALIDLATRELHVLDARSGRTRWSRTRPGSGPGELRDPRVLVRAPDRSLGVVDPRLARYTRFGARDGTLLDTRPLLDPWTINGGCQLPDGRLLIKGSRDTVSVLDDSGQPTSSRALAWPLVDTAPLAASGFIGGPDARGRCVVGRTFGNDWSVVSPDGAVATHLYVERTAEPRVVVTERSAPIPGSDRVRVERTYRTVARQTAAGVHLTGDTTVVVAVDRKARRWLDHFETASGRYLFSRPAPPQFTVVTVGGDGTVFGAVIGDLTALVAAVTPSAVPPRDSLPGPVDSVVPLDSIRRTSSDTAPAGPARPD